MATPVGNLICQRDSYKKEFSTKIFEKLNDKCFKLYDSILFPEGGGQPCDTGIIKGPKNSSRVVKVVREKDFALHYTEEELIVEPEDPVELILDWDRRFDHMQQHTGQHLISAIAEKQFQLDTVCWRLGVDVCTVDFNTPSISEQTAREIETIVNQKIKDSLPVKLHVANDREEYDAYRSSSKDIPHDVTGPIRMIEIDQVDKNVCCGTHVQNTSELIFIKFLNFEKSRNNTRLSFIVGNRIFRLFEVMLAREKAMTNLLNANPTSHVSLVEGLQSSSKQNSKSIKQYQTDIIDLLPDKIVEVLKAKLVSNNEWFAANHVWGDVEIIRKEKDSVSRIMIIYQREEPQSSNFPLSFLTDAVSQRLHSTFGTTHDLFFAAFIGSISTSGEGSFAFSGTSKEFLESHSKSLSELISGKGAIQKSKNKENSIFSLFTGKSKSLSKKGINLIREKIQEL